jgi:hypothetical protein
MVVLEFSYYTFNTLKIERIKVDYGIQKTWQNKYTC